MNVMVKNAAVKKYGKQILQGLTANEVKVNIEADPKKFKADEVDLILDAALEYKEGDGPAKDKAKAKAQENGDTKNLKYEEWEVEPIKKVETNPFNKSQTVTTITGWTKIKKIRETAITEDRAEMLNSQSEQSLRRLYLPE